MDKNYYSKDKFVNGCLLLIDKPLNWTSFQIVNKIKWLIKKKFNTFVGYSDHSNGIDSILSSISLGACVIEKHIALNKKDNPPDAKVSLEPNEFKHMVKRIREIETMLGKEKISVSQKEIRQKKTKKIISLLL